MKEVVDLTFASLNLPNTLPETAGWEEVRAVLATYLDELVQTDFNRLLSILYRIDVSETKVKASLAANPENKSAGYIIAGLIMERQQQKIEFRKQYGSCL